MISGMEEILARGEGPRVGVYVKLLHHREAHSDIRYGGDTGEGGGAQSGCGLAKVGHNVASTQRSAVATIDLRRQHNM